MTELRQDGVPRTEEMRCLYCKDELRLEDISGHLYAHGIAPPWEAGVLDPDTVAEALQLLTEVYAHVGPDGSHLEGPEVKIWVHRSTIDRLGGFLATVRARAGEPSEPGGGAT